MRTIKFRGQRIDTKEWVYGGYVFSTNGEWLSCIKYHTIVTEDGVLYQVDSDTVGQFTGLTDKNGKEIYEGDIVIHRNDGFRYAIEWHKSSNIGCNGGEYGFEINGFVPSRILDGTTKIDDYGNCETAYCRLLEGDVEVIGNIHENGDLLK